MAILQRRNIPVLFCALYLFSCATVSPLHAQPAAIPMVSTAPQTGSFELTFTTRSSLSEMKSLTKRLQLTDPTTDYDLAKCSFWVYVPEKYDPRKPLGLLVLVNYKPTTELPAPVLPQLAAANMALIVAKDFPDAWWQRAGLALDAAYNLFQHYKINRNRIYVFGGGEPMAGDVVPETSLRLGLTFPDVFAGAFSLGVLNYRPVKGPDKSLKPWPAQMPKPEDRYLSQAKGHPLVIAVPARASEWDCFVDAFKEDGFRNVKYLTITPDQYHYPNYTTDWLPDVLKFMDNAVGQKP